MPTPDFMDLGYDPEELPDPRMEIIGRGAINRKSKTLLPNIELAVLLGLTKEHIMHLTELFRSLHAAHYEVIIEETQDDGSKVQKVVPHVLTNSEIRERYSVIRKWEAFHQEQVDHYPSVGGFSTKAAFSMEDVKDRRDRKETSAGTDRSKSSRWE